MNKIYFIITLLLSSNFIAQTEPVVALALLENDNIAEVNINEEDFIKSIGEFTDVSKEAFKKIERKQKIAILLTVHKEGEATVDFTLTPR